MPKLLVPLVQQIRRVRAELDRLSELRSALACAAEPRTGRMREQRGGRMLVQYAKGLGL